MIKTLMLVLVSTFVAGAAHARVEATTYEYNYNAPDKQTVRTGAILNEHRRAAHPSGDLTSMTRRDRLSFDEEVMKEDLEATATQAPVERTPYISREDTADRSANPEIGWVETNEDKMLSQKVTDAIANDKSLANTSGNVQVFSNAGQVRLLGIVQTEQEKMAIGDKARAIEQVTQVDNQIEVVQDNR